MLRLTGVDKTFFPHTPNARRALAGVDLHLAEQEFTTVIGSNGAGKSTLLNVIAGVYPVDAGTVTLGGAVVNRLAAHQRAGRIGRVFQDPMAGTSPYLTIEQNLAIAARRGQRRGLRLAVTRARREEFRSELAQLGLGLEDRMRTHVGLLSGGQRQALSLLMASFTRPDILLLDEHTAALDPQRAELVTALTKNIVDRHRLTVLMVTHNMGQALAMGNRLLMMHEGRIILDLDAEQKARTSVTDLVDRFRDLGALSDRSLLG